MGRWTQYDEDDYRLPEGMKRVGYDADSGKYYFKDQNGSLWEGAEGAQYSEMKQVNSAPIALDGAVEDSEDIEAAGRRADGYQPVAANEGSRFAHFPQLSSQSPWRSLFPFLLIVVVVLLLIFRVVSSSLSQDSAEAVHCTTPALPYQIKAGDTCWDISRQNALSLDDLLSENPGLACEKLVPGQHICLAPSKN